MLRDAYVDPAGSQFCALGLMWQGICRSRRIPLAHKTDHSLLLLRDYMYFTKLSFPLWLGWCVLWRSLVSVITAHWRSSIVTQRSLGPPYIGATAQPKSRADHHGCSKACLAWASCACSSRAPWLAPVELREALSGLTSGCRTCLRCVVRTDASNTA